MAAEGRTADALNGHRPRRAAMLALAAAVTVSGCAAVAPPTAPVPAVPDAATVHLLGFGWHTEAVLPVEAAAAAMPGLVAAVVGPGARYVAFGFGERSYFTAAAPGSLDLARAALPGPAAIRATPLRDLPLDGAPGGPEVVTLRVPRDGPARAAAFVAASLARDPGTGALVPVAAEPGVRGDFFAAARGYALTYTCNTWVVDVLAAAGAPVSANGVVLGGQAVSRARAVADPGS